MITNRSDIQATSIVRSDDVLAPIAVYELEDGHLVAVSFAQSRTPANTLSCHVAAWQIGVEGAPVVVDDDDGLVLVETTHNATAQQIAELGVQGIAQAMVELVLGVEAGEAPPIPWSDQHRQTINIRTAITVAQAMNATIEF